MGTISISFPPVSLTTNVTGAPIMVSRQFTPVKTSDANSYTCITAVFGTPSGGLFGGIGSGKLRVQSNVM